MAWYDRHLNKNGKRSLHFKPDDFDLCRALHGDLSVPCGKCLGCLTDRRNNWINRMMFEHSSHGCKGSFITLTYDDAHLPPALDKSAVQRFLKRFRHVSRDYGVPLPPFKYFFCGERGSRFGRPHYHGLIFGVDMLSPAWKPYLASFKDSYPVYASRVLESLWPYGFVTVGNIDYTSIRYVSKYIVKRFGQEDSFTLKSQSLGADFFFDSVREGRKVHRFLKPNTLTDISKGILHFPAPHGKVRSVPVTKSFDRYLERIDPLFLEELKAKRLEFVLNSPPSDIAARAAYLEEVNKTKPNERKYDESY